jgi:hypothetical protein
MLQDALAGCGLPCVQRLGQVDCDGGGEHAVEGVLPASPGRPETARTARTIPGHAEHSPRCAAGRCPHPTPATRHLDGSHAVIADMVCCGPGE